MNAPTCGLPCKPGLHRPAQRLFSIDTQWQQRLGLNDGHAALALRRSTRCAAPFHRHLVLRGFWPAHQLLRCYGGCAGSQGLLGTLQSLGDEELAAWAADYRERLSLPFLSWLSDEEMAATSDPDRQQQLWELGSKLMALREGLSPVGADVLQAELRAAALRSCGAAGSPSDEDEQGPSAAAAGVRGGAAVSEQQLQHNGRPQDAQQPPAAAAATLAASPAFGSTVAAAAALGLSPEGLALFQQQAAALEAVVGTSRARSLVEVIGRAQVRDERQVSRVAGADAAVSRPQHAQQPCLPFATGTWLGGSWFLDHSRCGLQPLAYMFSPLPSVRRYKLLMARRLPPPTPACTGKNLVAPSSTCRAAAVRAANSTCTRRCRTCLQSRILEVLLSVQDRSDRAAMLPDAFTPPGSNAGWDGRRLRAGHCWC